MSSSVRDRTVPPAATPVRIVAAVVAAAVVASIGNVLVGLVMGAIEGRGSNPSFAIFLTVIGVVVGAVGWALIRRFVPRPAAVLRWLVPAVVLLSFVPDLLLFQKGATAVLVVGLMVMHVVVAAVAVIAFRRVLPV